LYLILYFSSSQKGIIEFAKKWKKHPSKIGYHLNKHRTTIAFHIRKLLKEDILISINKGSVVIYRINNLDEILDLIIKYDESVLAEAYGRFLVHIDDSYSRTARGVDEAIDIFNELFPPPFCS